MSDSAALASATASERRSARNDALSPIPGHHSATAAGPPTLAEIHAYRPPLTRPAVRSYHQLTEQEGGPPNERITEHTCIDTKETP